jgi:hypothetical protein
VQQVWVVAEVSEYGVPLVAQEPEAAHVACADPLHPWRHRDVPRTSLRKGLVEMPQKLAPSHQCAKCGKVFRVGDRVQELYVVDAVAVDPQIGAPGIRCAGQAEYAHKDCDDPDLSRGREALVVLS